MEFRLARPADLPRLEGFYREVVAWLLAHDLPIWDDVYPLCVLPDDVAKEELYLLEEGDDLLAALAIAPDMDWATEVPWPSGSGKPCYMARLAVRPGRLRQGLGRTILERGCDLARSMGYRSVRFFAIDFNAPAMALYRKLGFRPTGGVYLQDMGDGRVCRELAFEKQITP